MSRLVVFAMAVLACSTAPREPEMITLRHGASATIAGTRVSFTDVTDSRCAKGMTCVWEGDAAVRLESGDESLVLHTSARVGSSSGQLGGLTIELLEVNPEPVAGQETKKSEYVVTIRSKE